MIFDCIAISVIAVAFGSILIGLDILSSDWQPSPGCDEAPEPSPVACGSPSPASPSYNSTKTKMNTNNLQTLQHTAKQPHLRLDTKGVGDIWKTMRRPQSLNSASREHHYVIGYLAEDGTIT
jgi:hypothetical protein